MRTLEGKHNPKNWSVLTEHHSIFASDTCVPVPGPWVLLFDLYCALSCGTCVRVFLQAVMRSSPIVVALATFAAYVISGHELDAQTAFTSLALFGTIGHPFHVLPKVRSRYCSIRRRVQGTLR